MSRIILPQRISAPAKPGDLLKRFGPRPESERRSVKRDGYEDPEYLAMVRQMPCLCCGDEPANEAAHCRYASAAFGASSGMQRKPPDRLALPLCPSDHRIHRDAQHKHNERLWWEMLDINPHLVAEQLYAKRGDLVAMKYVCVAAIMNRKKEHPA